MFNKITKCWWSPVVITLIVCLGFVLFTFVTVDGDIWQFILIGTRYSNGDPQGSEGYDGQFGYYIAADPDPQNVRRHLDVPAYRYQRILLPMLARIFSFGQTQLIPWGLVFLPLFGQVLGVAFVAKILDELERNPLLALVYGLNAGSLLSIRVALPEPLAYACVAAALYAYLKDRIWQGAFWLALAFFAKEVTLVFGIGVLLFLWIKRSWKASTILLGIGFVPFLVWQVWLWQTFGEMGIGSGGAGATGFEWIPFMGLLRIVNYSRLYFIAMLIAFTPLIIAPSIWGLWATLHKLFCGEVHLITLALLMHCLIMFYLPFSTYRETGGVLRLSVGFVLAFLLYVAQEKQIRLMRYLPLWLVYNVFLFR